MSKPGPIRFESVSAEPRSGSLCRYFGECGGCSAQDRAYDEQLKEKARFLQNLLAEWWGEPIAVIPSPEIWHYRNKVDLNITRRHYDEPPPKDFVRDTYLGYNRKGKWYWPLDIEACSIAPACTEAILSAVRDWFRANDVRADDHRTGDGALRALLIREGRRTGETMVMLCTNEHAVDEASFAAALESAGPITSIYRGISRGRSQGAYAEELHRLAGATHIHEELHIPVNGRTRVFRYAMSPLSFFQTNTLATEVLYSEIRSWVKTTAPEILYDLYGGTGGIAISCADLAGIIRSVDNVPDALADGEMNLRLNGVDNVYFTTADMKDYLRFVYENGGMEPGSAAIVDPSRAGMNPKVVRRFLRANPERFLYVSCNPKVFAQELPLLAEQYRLESIKAIDLFPHTPHVELLAGFARRDC